MDESSRLEMARQLVVELESGNARQADDILQMIVRETESTLFQEIGKLTRELHDALVSVERDSRVMEITSNAIPDAKMRLKYVMEKTEAAAHRTLGAIEEMVPVADGFAKECTELQEEWARFTSRQMDLVNFKQLSVRIAEFLERSNASAQLIQKNLTDVLMAQDYQDLTGQVIGKVMELVQEVEHKLVDLVRVSGRTAGSPPVKAPPSPEQRTAAEGPQIGPAAAGSVMSSQDEVDDLLSSLGF